MGRRRTVRETGDDSADNDDGDGAMEKDEIKRK